MLNKCQWHLILYIILLVLDSYNIMNHYFLTCSNGFQISLWGQLKGFMSNYIIKSLYSCTSLKVHILLWQLLKSPYLLWHLLKSPYIIIAHYYFGFGNSETGMLFNVPGIGYSTLLFVLVLDLVLYLLVFWYIISFGFSFVFLVYYIFWI